MLLIYTKASSYVPLKILSIEDGSVLKSFNYFLHRNIRVDLIEQFNEKLLVKQEDKNLQILDVCICFLYLKMPYCFFSFLKAGNFDVQLQTSKLTDVSRTEFMTPAEFIFLYEKQLFLTFWNRTVAVWNFRGELVTSFKDRLLWHPDGNFNNLCITTDQNLIISYCKADSGDRRRRGKCLYILDTGC